MGKPNANNAAAEKAAAEKVAAEKVAAEKVAAEKVAAEKAAAEKAAAKQVKVPALSVVSSREGFRRGGRVWGKDETVVKLSDLYEEQIAQIKGEPLLTVAEIEVDEEAAE